jgi:pimeloyl-ACP methyl ester carboxylesterase
MMSPLILLSGMMCDARLYGPQIEALSGHYSLSLIPITNHSSIQQLAAEVIAQAPDRFGIAGLSMGGIVAMEVFAQVPDRIERIALLDTNPNAETEVKKNDREPQISRVLKGELENVMREDFMSKYLVADPQRNEILDLCLDMALNLGKTVFEHQSHALKNRPDQSLNLRRIKVPTLILCGQEDQLCPLEQHQVMHDLIKNSRLEIVEGAGHLPTLEQPTRTTEALLRWLREA